MLAETGLAHETILMRLTEGHQLKPAFLDINPNGKIPAIVDHDAAGGAISVFESGAILSYLAEKTQKFAPTSRRGRKEVSEWLFWQAANQGPMAGQLSHFVNYAPGGQDYSHQRYKGEFERSLAVLDTRLEGRDFVLDDYTIVDMMTFPWIFIAKPLGVDLTPFPNVAAWRQRIKQRPSVQTAIDLHKDAQFSNTATATKDTLLFNQSADHLRRQQTEGPA